MTVPHVVPLRNEDAAAPTHKPPRGYKTKCPPELLKAREEFDARFYDRWGVNDDEEGERRGHLATEMLFGSHSDWFLKKFVIRLRWPDDIIRSPYMPGSEVYICKNRRQKCQYKCRVTNKYFNLLTGTAFQGTRLSLAGWAWIVNIWTGWGSAGAAATVQQVALDGYVTHKTAFLSISKLVLYLHSHPEQIEYAKNVLFELLEENLKHDLSW